MTIKWKNRLSAVSVPLLLAACGGGAPQHEATPAMPAATPAPAAGGETAGGEMGGGEMGGGEMAAGYEVATVTEGGKVAGTVKFSGAEPEPQTLEVTKDGEVCGTEKTRDEVEVGADGGLKNVVVWIPDIARGKDWMKPGGEVDQQNCDYTPHVQAMPTGTSLEIVNSDPVLHNIHAYKDGETLFNIAQPTQGQRTPKKLNVTGPVELKCDVHSWMHAWIFVAPNPYYAVTGDGGSFEIADVPPGTYSAKAWHMALGQKDMQVTVAANGTATADFTFMPQ